jgi:hypothetical protein
MKTIKKTENKGKNEKRKRKETRAENADGRRARAHAAIAIASGARARFPADLCARRRGQEVIVMRRRRRRKKSLTSLNYPRNFDCLLQFENWNFKFSQLSKPSNLSSLTIFKAVSAQTFMVPQ